MSALPNGYKTLKTYWSDFLGYDYKKKSNSIIKYGFILFFYANRYFTPLHLKPSFFTGGGVVGYCEPAPSDTLTVKLYILTLFEMIFSNCRDNFENN